MERARKEGSWREEIPGALATSLLVSLPLITSLQDSGKWDEWFGNEPVVEPGPMCSSDIRELPLLPVHPDDSIWKDAKRTTEFTVAINQALNGEDLEPAWEDTIWTKNEDQLFLGALSGLYSNLDGTQLLASVWLEGNLEGSTNCFGATPEATPAQTWV